MYSLSLSIYIYICMYVYIYIYIYTHVIEQLSARRRTVECPGDSQCDAVRARI